MNEPDVITHEHVFSANTKIIAKGGVWIHFHPFSMHYIKVNHLKATTTI